MRLISMQAVKAVAATTVICGVIFGAVLSAWTAAQHSPVSTPAGPSQPRNGGMPRFYVTVAGLEVVVRASGDGHVTGSVAIPGPPASGRNMVGAEAFGGQDDRHFVIVVSRGGDLPGVADVTLFRLTVSSDGRPGTLGQLSFDNRSEPVIGAALSPDGKMLALSLVHEFPPGPLHGSVVVINLASGATRTWTGQNSPGYWPGVPAWFSDSAIAVPWWHDTGHGMIPAEITGVRQLDAAAPGNSLAATRLAAFAVPVPGLESAMLAPGGAGGQVITSSCHARHHTTTVRVAALSGTDGRLVRVLRTQTTRFGNDADAQDAALSMCQVLSVAGDGDQLLVQAFGFGRIDNGVFTSLPGTTPRVLPVAAAW